jgi:DNA-binding transcriptional LysR family regulator
LIAEIQDAAMNLKHIEAFVQVARTGSVSAAAARLNTTQPAISMRLRDLERDLDTKLLDRSRRSVRLTPAGRTFLERAERIHALAEEALAEFGSEHTMVGRIRLGVTETIALTWLPELVGRINGRFPEVAVELDVDLTEGVFNRLYHGDLELAMLPGPVGGPNLETRSLGKIRYDWMASPSLKVPNRMLTPVDLAAWPIITLSHESNLHDVIEGWFREHGAKPRRIDVCNSLGVVASLTMAGLGIAMLPPSVFAGERRLKALATEPKIADLDFVAAYPRNTDSPLIRAIAEMAVEVSTFRTRPAGRA